MHYCIKVLTFVLLATRYGAAVWTATNEDAVVVASGTLMVSDEEAER
jgi:hypothetical protein